MAFTPKLMYKGRPLVRCGSEIYYGSMADPFVVSMQVQTTKEDHGVEIADRILVMLMSTDTSRALPDRIIKKAPKSGLYTALEIGGMWLERQLKEAGAAAKPADKAAAKPAAKK